MFRLELFADLKQKGLLNLKGLGLRIAINCAMVQLVVSPCNIISTNPKMCKTRILASVTYIEDANLQNIH